MSEPLIERLRKKVNYLSAQQPWNTVQSESIHIQDSALWDENKLEISGNMKQEKRSGKNVLNLNKLEVYKNTNNSYSINGTNSITVTSKSDNAYLNTAFKLKLEDGTYIFNLGKVQNSNSSMTFKRMTLSAYINGTRTAIQHIDVGQSYNITITNEDNKLYILEFWGSYNTALLNTAIFSDIYIAKESTFSGYEQYGAMPSTEFPSMPLVCSGVQKIRQFRKNWFDKDNANILNAYTSSSITADANSRTFYIRCKPNTTYTISRTKIGNRFQVGETIELPKAGTKLENLIPSSFINAVKSITITTSASAKYLVVFYSNASQNNGYTEEELRSSIQIEEGNTVTDYEPYTEEIHTLDLGSTELCAIVDANGNVVAQDRHVYRNGKWQWEKIIKKLVLNGTESWTMTSLGFFACTSLVKNYALNNNNIVCTHFKGRINVNNSNELELEEIAFNDNINYSRLYIHTLQFTTAEELKTWLSNNNVTLYYVLETPIYTDCTADQSAILDKLYNNFKLQKGVNNIIVETDNGVGVNMELTYMQDLQTKLNILEAMCVSNASQEV